MLTENDARALLAQAADTIEVGPAAPVEPVRRRAWPVLAAAAATLVAGVGIWAGVAATDDTDAAPAPSVDTGPIAPGEVPNVFGRTRAGAQALLTAAGYEVQVDTEGLSCTDGQVVRTEPGPGSRLEPGSVVRLVVSKPWVTADCAQDPTIGHQLISVALGDLPPPELFGGPVPTYLNSRRQVVEDPTTLAGWVSPSVLDALRSAATWAPSVPRTLEILDADAPGCDGPPARMRETVAAELEVQRYAVVLDMPDPPCVQLSVVDPGGLLVTLVGVETRDLPIDTAPAPGHDVPTVPAVPAVFGLTEGEALATLRRAGVTNLVTEAEPACYEAGRALGTEPVAGTTLDAATSVRLAVTSDDPRTNCDVTDRAFWSLLDFARGGKPPTFAREVTTWVDGVASVESDPETLRSWGSGSPLEVLLAVAGDTRPDAVDGRVFAHYGIPVFDGLPSDVVDLVPDGCQVKNHPEKPVPAGLADRTSFPLWFAYQRDGETRACFLFDLYVDDRGDIEAIVVRTVDPDGLLPVRAARPAGEEAGDLASTFVAFARGELDEPMFLADEVRLYDDGRYVRTATAAELVDRDAWLVCDTGGSDRCLGSALEALAYAVGDVPVAEGVPRGDLPPGTASVVRVGPPEVTSCQPRGIVSLYVTDTESIVGVDVTDASATVCDEEGLVPPE